MNLRIANPEGLVAYLHSTLSALPAVHAGDRCSVVETAAGLFYVGNDPVEVGGPFPSLAHLVREAGVRRRRYPEEGPARVEVMEWDGWFFRVARDRAHPFKQLASATAEAFELAFQWWGGDVGILLTRARWEHLRTCQRALRAATWGDFRAALPPGEFTSLCLWASEGGEMVYREDGAIHFGRLSDLPAEDPEEWIISAEDPFDAFHVPGVEDGTYPDWLGASEDVELPPGVFERFGERVGGFTAGVWTQYSAERLDEMAEALEEEGFVLTLRSMEGVW